MILAIPVTLVAVNGTGDLCGEPFDSPGRTTVYPSGFDDTIPSVLTTCEATDHGTEFRDTRFNEEGTIGSIFFPVGVFFGSAGLLGLIDRRRAFIATAAVRRRTAGVWFAVAGLLRVIPVARATAGSACRSSRPRPPT